MEELAGDVGVEALGDYVVAPTGAVREHFSKRPSEIDFRLSLTVALRRGESPGFEYRVQGEATRQMMQGLSALMRAAPTPRKEMESTGFELIFTVLGRGSGSDG